MSQLVIPPIERDEQARWPSLGPQVADWMEANLAFGPGDLASQRYELDEEDRGILERAYQVHPPQHEGRCRFERGRCTVGNGRCGRRRFDTVVLMLRKGSKKSERAASFAAVELAPDSPVRCDGFRREGRRWVPAGRPVTSPFVYVFAFAKEQAEDTCFDALKAMIENGPGASQFVVWEDRILRADGTGEAKAMASAPDSKDGAKTTFQVKEEAHRWTEPRHHEAHSTTLGNLSKRPIAEPWEFFPTTAYAPGEASVAEQIHDAARRLDDEAAKRSRMFFFYRWADTRIRIRNDDGSWNEPGLLRAIDDASGPVQRVWSPAEDIMSRQFLAPGADPNYAERVWLNRTRKTTSQAFDLDAWKDLADPSHRVPDGALVVLAWHGARFADAGALIAVEISTGYLWPIEVWEQPADATDWQLPDDEVDLAVANAFDRLAVHRFYVNRDQWEADAADWARIYGKDRVKLWAPEAKTAISRAIRAFGTAIRAGDVSHPGDRANKLTAHLGAAQRVAIPGMRDEDGQPIYLLRKERQDAPHPINGAMAAVIGWQARLDALRDGADVPVTWTAV